MLLACAVTPACCGLGLVSAGACGAAASADPCGLLRTSASAVGGMPCSSHSLVSRDSGLDRKSLSRRSRACEAEASEGGGGTCGLFEELAPLLDSRARPDAGSWSVCPAI
ncbi:hypothetical protein A3SK_0105235 [Pseudomonas amygdali pv. tabaci str. 6605]|nr:hypothetical protein A3SK_0105235 [Pseudomonas amygdali pv. tabaci str. 6605]